jgi:hypothetical protein
MELATAVVAERCLHTIHLWSWGKYVASTYEASLTKVCPMNHRGRYADYLDVCDLLMELGDNVAP